jgi:4-hydroxy-tetrahydrodipicolinate reductase
MKRIGIVGRNGRMAQEVAAAAHAQELDVEFIERERVEASEAPSRPIDGLIDFSLPEATSKVLAWAIKQETPLVCGTTGFGDPTQTHIQMKEAARKIPIVWDANFSVGIELMCQNIESWARNLETQFLISDIHHAHKKDSPSGTALKLKQRLLNAGATEDRILISSARLGTVPGEHRVLISLPDESLEITHRASSRRVFAEGALRALKWALDKKSGLYSMKDVFEHEKI